MSDQSRREVCYTLAVLILITIFTILRSKAEDEDYAPDVILTTVICKRGVCVEIYIPTPISFRCNDPTFYEEFLKQNYPSWRFRRWRCDRGAHA